MRLPIASSSAAGPVRVLRGGMRDGDRGGEGGRPPIRGVCVTGWVTTEVGNAMAARVAGIHSPVPQVLAFFFSLPPDVSSRIEQPGWRE
jgi:hypothetical protein